MDVDRLLASLTARAQDGEPMEALLEAAVHGVHELDSRFHWTGIYELYPDQVLRLGPFIGAPTDHVFIAVGTGVCGSAVAGKCNMNVPDVTRVSNYLPCSSETRSELVILIRKGDTIYAQIDIDSHEIAAFDDRAVVEVQRVADWLADQYEARALSRHGS